MKVFIIGGGLAYQRMFVARGWEVVNDPISADLIQFTGGEDVTPEIYGEKNTHSGNSLRRDLQEAGYFAIAKRMNKFMAGICRGGQFLNVMCGGKMEQHIEGHAIHGTHEVNVFDSKELYTSVTSTHHQGMLPYIEKDYYASQFMGGIVLARAPDNVVEVIYYEYDKVLCFQPHPEFDGYKKCTDYYFELLEDYLGLK